MDADSKAPENYAAAPAPIYVIKKKIHGHGHHGGAWKVAYADFVTAMMAFFLVMWLMGASEKVKQAVSGYFRDPQGHKKESGTGTTGEGEQITVSKDDMSALKDKIQSAMKQLPDFKLIRDHVAMTVTGEGLRIELMEKEKGMLFESGSAKPSEFGKDLLQKMSKELAKLPNDILIEGHTDSKPFSSDGEYTNWELSTDRANAARRVMTAHGFRAGQMKQVRGFADQRLFEAADPESAKNRRISVIVQYLNAPDVPVAEKGKEEKGKEAAKEGHGEVKAAEPAKSDHVEKAAAAAPEKAHH